MYPERYWRRSAEIPGDGARGRDCVLVLSLDLFNVKLYPERYWRRSAEIRGSGARERLHNTVVVRLVSVDLYPERYWRRSAEIP